MTDPRQMRYTADLCGTISQSLKALQGPGIMALELIQNADDAGASRLSFDVRDDALVVRNSAKFTNCGHYGEVCHWETAGSPTGNRKACNIHAISTMGARSKFESANQIGRFGIGFVSVYQITDTPIIRSGDCELTLNPIAPEIKPKIVALREGTEFELPWARDETLVRKAIDDTPVPPNISEIVLEELLETIGSSTLFLRNLEEVEVFRSGKPVEKLVIERGSDELSLRYCISGELKRWLLLRTSAQPIIDERNLFENYPQLEEHKRSAEVTLAVPIDQEILDGKLFAFLPTQQSSRLPLHVNCDFYPESSRKDIVLKGLGQERQWNEALIQAAAALIEGAFEDLREKLGPIGLWQLGESCWKQRDDEFFGCYWEAFSAAARQSNSVITATDVWSQPAAVYFDDENHDSDTVAMLSELGLSLVSEKIRLFRDGLEAVGVRRLNSGMLVEAIAKRAPARNDVLRPYLSQVWKLVGKIIQKEGGLSQSKHMKRLRSACFLLDSCGNAVAPDQVWRMPSEVKAERILKILPECPIISPDAIEVAGIPELLDEYNLPAFAKHLAQALSSEELSRDLLGAEGEVVKELYELLLAFPTPADPARIAKLLKAVPLLRTQTGYVTPERAQLPGGFSDPTGNLEFVDISHFPAGMGTFASLILGVRILSFADYLENELPRIVDGPGLASEAFCAIAEQIVARRRELKDAGVFESLSALPFIPTRALTLVKAHECYKWTAEVERVLGREPQLFLHEDWMPKGALGAKFRDILETELEMPTRPTLAHMLRRIEQIADADIVIDDTIAALDILVERLCDLLQGANEDVRSSISKLKRIPFLPALLRGERDTSQLYRPSEIYQATRASGFASQVPVIELNALRRPGRHRTDLMNFIGMPQVPPAEVVVAHLRFCVETGAKASTITYDLLNEAVTAQKGLSEIRQLAVEPYIFDPQTDGYLKANEVFWSAPGMGRYWRSASQDMHRQLRLHEFLGVRESPGPEDYARLMVEICCDPEPEPGYRDLHEQCIVRICRALETDDPGVQKAFELLADEPSLISREGDGVFPADALWMDRPYLAEPFGIDLDDRLVEPPQLDRATLGRFYKRMGIEPLSSLAVQRLAEEPDRLLDKTATEVLRDRSDLLLWLAPNETARTALRTTLNGLSIGLTEGLMVQVELSFGAAPVVSIPTMARAYLEPSMLHVRGFDMSQGAWTSAFRQLFLSIEHHCPQTDVKPLATTAVLVVKSDSRDDAEAALLATDFSPPPISGWQFSEAAALDDLEPHAEREELLVGSADGCNSEISLGNLSASSENVGSREDVLDSYQSDIAEINAAQENKGDVGASDTNKSTDSVPLDNGAISITPNLLEGRSAQGSADANLPEKTSNSVPVDNDYKSKVGSRSIGAEAIKNPSLSGGESANGMVNAQVGNRQGKPKSDRMLAYVSRSGDRPGNDREGNSDEQNKKIDARAIERVMRYEVDQGRTPVEQDHFNPGFDIISTGTDGKRRLIEVKGLLGPWNERGTKLSRTQFSMAQSHADEFWIYIVEAALDPNAQQLFAIRNPFQKVDEYWFDSAWKGLAERLANTVQLNARAGTNVRHEQWGKGVIMEIKKFGLQTHATVDFGYEGKKFIPFDRLKFAD